MSGPDDKNPDLFCRSAPVLAAQLRDGTISARGLLEHFQDRIARLNPRLNALIGLDPDAALQADISDANLRAGRPRGSLEGIPVAVKDNLWTRGVPAVWGSPLFSGHVPDHDELAVAKIRAAGAVLIGKTNCPEFAMRGITDNPVFGPTKNPWDLHLTPGGSSGGAVAAVAAGLVPLALATDGGGSIRRPAAHTGLAGLKPTAGRVRRGGGFPQLMLDCEVIGPIARSVSGVRHFFQAMAQKSSSPVSDRRLRILYVDRIGDAPVAPEILRSCAKAAERMSSLGHQVVSGALPFSIEGALAAWSVIGTAGFARLAATEPHFFEQTSPDFIAQARLGEAMSAAEYAKWMEVLLDFRVETATAFDAIDVIMTPATAAQPWPLHEPHPKFIAGKEVGPRGHAVFTAWVNVAGLPALALPAEPDANGIPIGFQLVGAPGQDELLLDAGEAFEQAYPQTRWPALALELV